VRWLLGKKKIFLFLIFEAFYPPARAFLPDFCCSMDEQVKI
jgi:hypothetical protein